MEKKESSEEIWEKLEKDQYMSCAVREVFESVRLVLTDLVQGEGGTWCVGGVEICFTLSWYCCMTVHIANL